MSSSLNSRNGSVLLGFHSLWSSMNLVHALHNSRGSCVEARFVAPWLASVSEPRSTNDRTWGTSVSNLMSYRCTRCTSPADSVMSFDYPDRCMWISDIDTAPEPGTGYLLCSAHAARLGAPVGWTLIDKRSPMARLFAVPA